MRNHFVGGVSLILLGAFFYACQAAIIKALALDLPPLPVIIFGQSAFALLLMLPFVFNRGWRAGCAMISTRRLSMHGLRSIFSLGISYLLFYLRQIYSIGQWYVAGEYGPIIVPFLAWGFLGQK